jgi:hypothetical protein
MDDATRNLTMLLEPFKLRMEDETQRLVLHKTKDLWNMKAVKEGREVRLFT